MPINHDHLRPVDSVADTPHSACPPFGCNWHTESTDGVQATNHRSRSASRHIDGVVPQGFGEPVGEGRSNLLPTHPEFDSGARDVRSHSQRWDRWTSRLLQSWRRTVAGRESNRPTADAASSAEVGGRRTRAAWGPGFDVERAGGPAYRTAHLWLGRGGGNAAQSAPSRNIVPGTVRTKAYGLFWFSPCSILEFSYLERVYVGVEVLYDWIRHRKYDRDIGKITTGVVPLPFDWGPKVELNYQIVERRKFQLWSVKGKILWCIPLLPVVISSTRTLIVVDTEDVKVGTPKTVRYSVRLWKNPTDSNRLPLEFFIQNSNWFREAIVAVSENEGRKVDKRIGEGEKELWGFVEGDTARIQQGKK